jgi:hypothetical protein
MCWDVLGCVGMGKTYNNLKEYKKMNHYTVNCDPFSNLNVMDVLSRYDVAQLFFEIREN